MPDAPADYRRLRYGHFAHLVPGLTTMSSGRVLVDPDELADGFDVVRYADDVEAFGIDHVVFTAWHRGMLPLYPSAVMERWRGAGCCTRRDLVGELVAEVRRRGIAVVLYTHPRDGHDFEAGDQVATGWGATSVDHAPDPDWAGFDYRRWNDFVCEAYEELLQRYGRELSGLYLDEGSERGDSEKVVDYQRLRRVIKGASPHVRIVQNWYGSTYTADSGDKEYFRWQEFATPHSDGWPAYSALSVSSVNASIWWASRPSTEDVALFDHDDLVRYSVLQISANRSGGGIRWAAGPYADGGWELGYAEQMCAVGARLRAVEESLFGVVPSSWLPTVEGTTMSDLRWGVATESPDGASTYLHVLKTPTTQTLEVDWPHDAPGVVSAALLPDGFNVAATRDGDRIVLVLPEGCDWDPVHAVVRLQHQSY